MWRSLASRCAQRSVVILSLCSGAGCLGAGQPWGWLEASMDASFEPPEGRLDGEGRLKTSRNYAVALDDIQISFDAFTIVLAAAGAASFDPSSPPAGYSLCHNGHCHSDAGELVDYEVIALEMVGGSGGARVAIELDNEPLDLSAGKVAVEVSPCEPSPCELPKGELAGLELTIGSLSLQGTVYDGLTGDSPRVPEEGLAFDVTVPTTQALKAQLEGSIGPGESVGLQLDVGFNLPPALFDEIDFGAASPTDTASWQTLLRAALDDHSALSVTLERK